MSAASVLATVWVAAALHAAAAPGVRLLSTHGPEQLGRAAVVTLTADAGEVWAGTTSGLHWLGRGARAFRRLDAPREGEVTAVATSARFVYAGGEGWIAAYRREDGGRAADASVGRVRAIAIGGGAVWAVADDRVVRFEADLTAPRSFGLAEGLPGPARTVHWHQGVLYVGGEGTVWSEMRAGTPPFRVREAPPGSVGSITCLGVSGESVWFGTAGGGVRIFGRRSGSWTTLGRAEGLTLGFVTRFAADGRISWLGGFGGVARHDLESGEVSFVRPEGSGRPLPDDPVDAVAVDGRRLVLAYGARILILDKGAPQVEVRAGDDVLLQSAGTHAITGEIRTERALARVQLSYALAAFPDAWFTKGLEIDTPPVSGPFAARWNTVGLPDGAYLIRLEAAEDRGGTNAARTLVTLDTRMPEVSFDAASAGAASGGYVLAGRVNKPTIERLVVRAEPDGAEETVSVDPADLSFRHLVTLRPGPNRYSAAVVDRVGRRGSGSVTIQADGRARAEAAVSVQREGRAWRLRLPDRLLFLSGDAAPATDGRRVIAEAARVVRQFPRAQLVVEGHTDNLPLAASSAYSSNEELSLERARAVARLLSRSSGVAEDRIVAIGYADRRPAASNASETGRLQNRRVEILIVPE